MVILIMENLMTKIFALLLISNIALCIHADPTETTQNKSLEQFLLENKLPSPKFDYENHSCSFKTPVGLIVLSKNLTFTVNGKAPKTSDEEVIEYLQDIAKPNTEETFDFDTMFAQR